MLSENYSPTTVRRLENGCWTVTIRVESLEEVQSLVKSAWRDFYSILSLTYFPGAGLVEITVFGEEDLKHIDYNDNSAY